MTPLITLILGLAVGYLIGLRAHEYFKPKAQFIEPKEYPTGYWDYSKSPTQFVEAMSPKEKFKVAKNITDLL